MTTRERFSDELREAVKSSEHSANAVARGTGIDRGALSKFLAGKRGLSLDSIDALAEFLGLHVSGPKPATPRRTKPPSTRPTKTQRKG